MADVKFHWETVYNTKNPDQVSWTQNKPEISLNFIKSFNVGAGAKIIDVGGGDSKLVDFLLKEGYYNLTILDISGKAIENAKQRLGNDAEKVKWIESDILDFHPQEKYDIWHDRATFHFLVSEEDKKKYVEIAAEAVANYMVVGTFSEQGPKKCSGLEISQYSTSTLTHIFKPVFQQLECKYEDHMTPMGIVQNFIFCSFTKI